MRAPTKQKIEKIYHPKALRQITRENIKLNDEELDRKLFEK